VPALLAILALWLASGTKAWVDDPQGATWRYLGVGYLSLPALALIVIRNDAAYGFAAIMWIMVTVWAADSLAYFAGRTIGGPKLAPVLSPKKTWAGLAGAVVGSAVASGAFALIAGLPGVLPLMLLAGCLAIVEQGGDLFKSAMKRHYGVKDSGNLIPGHGGIIDRVDGLVAVAVAAAIIGAIHGGLSATGSGLLLW
jgi:phosphatidate cytidylyltransferase